MSEEISIGKGILAMLIIVSLLIGGVIGYVIRGDNEVEVEVEGPACEVCKLAVCDICESPISLTPEETICPTNEIEVVQEVSDDELFNMFGEFLESEFEYVFNDIKGNATIYAFEELSDHDFRVVSDYIMSLIEGVDEESIKIAGEDFGDYDLIEIEDLEDVEVRVTKLGLGEEEDKSARVTFEIEVDYKVRVESENGYVTEYYSKDIVVIYDVVFDEGYFTDEEVELVSIV